jgi:hypothetical protein
MMWQWKQHRERRRQTRRALQLLTVSGAVRPVDIVIRYRSTNRLLGTSSDTSSSSHVEPNRLSVWNTDIKELWNRYRDGAVKRSSFKTP